MPVHDVIAVGLGPFNLSLACLMAPLKDHDALFLERNAEFAWHPGMLVDGCTLQNPFLADLVSLADPTSRYSYLNYCKQQGMLHARFVAEKFYLTRQEYNRYCRWAASQLASLRFHREVTAIAHDAARALYVVAGRDVRTGRPFELACRRLVLGVGSVPRLPECCEPGGPWLHSSAYLAHKAALQRKTSITIVGSGQSAAEICCDLLHDIDRHDYALTWVTRSPRFFQMEDAKLALELMSPDYDEHFFGLDAAVKERIVSEQNSVFNGINARLVNAIYDLLDERRDPARRRVRLLPNMALVACRTRGDDGFELDFHHRDLDRRYRHRTDALVLATGYAPRVPDFVDGIRHRIAWDAQGRYAQRRNYAVDVDGCEIFVQNAGCHAHGIASPDLSLTCHRNACIVRELTGVEHYRVERGTTLQDFAPRAGDTAFVEMPA
jgi:lysine N6-hydroxylase